MLAEDFVRIPCSSEGTGARIDFFQRFLVCGVGVAIDVVDVAWLELFGSEELARLLLPTRLDLPQLSTRQSRSLYRTHVNVCIQSMAPDTMYIKLCYDVLPSKDHHAPA